MAETEPETTEPEKPETESSEDSWNKLESFIDKSVEKAMTKWGSKKTSESSSTDTKTEGSPAQKGKSFLEKLISG